MTFSAFDPKILAADAVRAWHAHSARDLPSSRGPFTLEEGYRARGATDDLLRRDGWRPVGRKLGFTDRAAWSRLGLERPVWGYVYDATVADLDAGSTFDTATAVAARAEVEVVLGLREAPRDTTRSAMLDAIGWAALGFEIIDNHYPAWKFTPADALADLIFHRALLVGARRRFGDAAAVREWSKSLPAATTLRDRDSEVAHGGTEAVMGDPITALAELAAMIRDQGAAPLSAGELIATGTTIPAFTLAPGQVLRAEIDRVGLEPISLRIV